MRVLGIFLACLVQGCLVIPMREHDPKYGTRGEIDEPALEELEVGKATRDHVLLSLGQPELTFARERYYAYHWALRMGMLINLVAPQAPMAADLMSDFYLVLNFDSGGRLESKQVVEGRRSFDQVISAALGGTGDDPE